jgi:hypothetical protein
MGKLGSALLLLFAFGPGCGGGGPTMPQAACLTFIEMAYCPKVVACSAQQSDGGQSDGAQSDGGQSSGGPIDQAECMMQASMGLNCSKAVGENGDPALCMRELAAAACDTFTTVNIYTLPQSCRGLFQLSP